MSMIRKISLTKSRKSIVVDVNHLLTKYRSRKFTSSDVKIFLQNLKKWLARNNFPRVYIWYRGHSSRMRKLVKLMDVAAIGRHPPVVDLKYCGTLWELCPVFTGRSVERKNRSLNVIMNPPHQSSIVPFRRTRLKESDLCSEVKSSVDKVQLKYRKWAAYYRHTSYPANYVMRAPDEVIDLATDEFYLSRIRRVRSPFSERWKKIREVRPLNEYKKLVVLDIDHTIVHYEPGGLIGIILVRPFLHEFLTKISKHYNIAFWSAGSWRTINTKLKHLNILHNSNYKVALLLSVVQMLSVHVTKFGPGRIKPLEKIWWKYQAFSAKNTIMIDDKEKNFAMNPQSGLVIRRFKISYPGAADDRELRDLALYLEMISDVEDFRTLDHRNWREYCSTHKKI